MAKPKSKVPGRIERGNLSCVALLRPLLGVDDVDHHLRVEPGLDAHRQRLGRRPPSPPRRAGCCRAWRPGRGPASRRRIEQLAEGLEDRLDRLEHRSPSGRTPSPPACRLGAGLTPPLTGASTHGMPRAPRPSATLVAVLGPGGRQVDHGRDAAGRERCRASPSATRGRCPASAGSSARFRRRRRPRPQSRPALRRARPGAGPRLRRCRRR